MGPRRAGNGAVRLVPSIHACMPPEPNKSCPSSRRLSFRSDSELLCSCAGPSSTEDPVALDLVYVTFVVALTRAQIWAVDRAAGLRRPTHCRCRRAPGNKVRAAMGAAASESRLGRESTRREVPIGPQAGATGAWSGGLMRALGKCPASSAPVAARSGGSGPTESQVLVQESSGPPGA